MALGQARDIAAELGSESLDSGWPESWKPKPGDSSGKLPLVPSATDSMVSDSLAESWLETLTSPR